MFSPWSIFLLLLWAVLLFGGFLFGSSPEPGRRMPKWTRLSSSAVLVLLAWSAFYAVRSGPAATYALLVALGMTAGFIGDLFIAGLLLRKGGRYGGIASFAVGHILYIAAILWFGRAFGLNQSGLMIAALVVWWLIGFAGWYAIVFRGSARTRLHWIVLPYALLLASTAGLATGLALQQFAFWSLVVGAALFLLSDTILGGVWFSDLQLPLVHDLIWLTYGPGQMLIVTSIAAANGVAAFL